MTNVQLRLFAFLLLWTGCSTTNEDLAEAQAEALAGQLAHVSAIHGTATALEPITTRPTRVSLELDFGLTRNLSEANPANNAQVLYLEQLAPDHDGSAMELQAYSPAWLKHSRQLADGRFGGLPQPEQMTEELEQLERMQYLLVIRTQALTQPEVVEGSFVPGEFRGDALLYDVATEELVTALPLRVQNGDEVRFQVLEGSTGPSEDGLRDIVTRDLRNLLGQALTDGLRDDVGARLPSPVPL